MWSPGDECDARISGSRMDELSEPLTDVSCMCSAKFSLATLAQVAPSPVRSRHHARHGLNIIPRPSAGLLVVMPSRPLIRSPPSVLLHCTKVPLLASSDCWITCAIAG